MQHEVLLTNAAMAITKLTNESNEALHITHSKFGSGSAALVIVQPAEDVIEGMLELGG